MLGPVLLLCAAALRPCAALLHCTAAGRDAAACAALGELYDGAGGAAWANRSGWADAAAGVPTDYCAFSGLACDATGALTALCAPARRTRRRAPRAPVRLDPRPRSQRCAAGADAPAAAPRNRSALGSNNLQGSLPDALGLLTNLTTLCVSDSDAHHYLTTCGVHVHDARADCVRARRPGRGSDVSNNVLQGTVPASLGSLTRLTSLCAQLLRGCACAGLGCKRTQTLTRGAAAAGRWRLTCCSRTASRPPSRSSRACSRCACALQAAQPCATCARADAAPCAGRARSNVTNNVFSGPLPSFLGALPLRTLAVARNFFTGVVPASLGASQSLQTLCVPPAAVRARRRRRRPRAR